MLAILATSQNGMIGFRGGLPWGNPIKKDMEMFRAVTLEREYCIVGRNTFDALPKLKGRKLLVLTRYPDTLPKDKKNSLGGEFYDTVSPEEVKYLQNLPHVCIGGKFTYETCFPYSEGLFVTLVKREFDGDVRCPEFTHLFQPESQIYTDELIDIIHYTKNEKV